MKVSVLLTEAEVRLLCSVKIDLLNELPRNLFKKCRGDKGLYYIVEYNLRLRFEQELEYECSWEGGMKKLAANFEK